MTAVCLIVIHDTTAVCLIVIHDTTDVCRIVIHDTTADLMIHVVGYGKPTMTRNQTPTIHTHRDLLCYISVTRASVCRKPGSGSRENAFWNM